MSLPQENNNVTVFREKIKDFLAAQGMIKGHSGANNGRGDEAQQILVLIPDHVRGRASSSSPPTTPSSADDEAAHHAHAHLGRLDRSGVRYIGLRRVVILAPSFARVPVCQPSVVPAW